MKDRSIYPIVEHSLDPLLGIGVMIARSLTGTFFCDKTTAQFFPRTPTDVMLAAVIALKAYSVETWQ